MQQKTALLRKFTAAISLLTAIRMPDRVSLREEELRGTQMFFPFVGAGLGFALAGIYGLLIRRLPAQVTIVGVLTVALTITAARNEQSLARVADAMQRGTRESRREKLKHTLLGTVGTITLTLTLILKFALLSYLPPQQCWWALLAGSICGCWMMVALRQVTEYTASGNELGTALSRRLPWKQFVGVTVLCALVTLPLGPVAGIATWLMVFLALFMTKHFLKGLFGGLMIESARAAAIIGELTVYFAAAMFR